MRIVIRKGFLGEVKRNADMGMAFFNIKSNIWITFIPSGLCLFELWYELMAIKMGCE